ncbi:hypothetical protein CcaverHIS002_0200980 [Cutaneotrichosporon cavernicola]|uniref:Terpenoid synthase n=1 Tax=Cutaneotrichosporon cavernicola TaxID=279322 RepID=A0AA48ID43_9TREE|nr:uncharacterized protein CcaverHIS019_0201030 [Cutaneotrichosporon cavernicola]BEI80938.1 hypothetical protein CcaverHIS002_0200980 [Cutaneotrichosporon cavernicola]BEI88741.1 hypothetical protein CcaverHIS019_0201030 [Cutaneotrichosporon cavernicola]BEI96516.1 hypothetical protein CcaverHIS631_0201050 [Cutaneotrichosporon cavernicola]BEJ04288.1 hypothetical protein CcaverHIS641_0201050 [Cutaneotrichosporon cavernicola]
MSTRTVLTRLGHLRVYTPLRAFSTSRALSSEHPPSPANPANARQVATAGGRTHRTPGAPLNSPVAAGGPGENAAYCASLLELHLVTTTVSQPAIAAMRFQFWRDALAAIFSGKPAPQHPVALALAEMHAARPVQRYYLGQLIDVRAKNLAAPSASATLEQHLATYSPLAGALLQGPLPILLSPTDPETGHIAHTLSHIAHLLAVSSLLRALPSLVAKRQLNIPADVSARHGLVDEEVFRRGTEAPGLKDALFEIATRGMDELITARRDLNKTDGKVVPKECMPLFLAAVPAERYLHRLEKADFDVFAPELAKHDWQLAPRIWWAYHRGKL